MAKLSQQPKPVARPPMPNAAPAAVIPAAAPPAVVEQVPEPTITLELPAQVTGQIIRQSGEAVVTEVEDSILIEEPAGTIEPPPITSTTTHEPPTQAPLEDEQPEPVPFPPSIKRELSQKTLNEMRAGARRLEQHTVTVKVATVAGKPEAEIQLSPRTVAEMEFGRAKVKALTDHQRNLRPAQDE